MKAKLQPVYFEGCLDNEYTAQLDTLKKLFADEAEFLESIQLGQNIPTCDGVVFPVLNGQAYKDLNKIQKIQVPIVLITSEFGTVSMWDWEIVTFLKDNGVNVLTPYQIAYTKTICRTLALKRELKTTSFLVFQDNPGEGMQPAIFKRFYWWEESWQKALLKKFGIRIIVKSFRELGSYAKSISDAAADKVIEQYKLSFPCVDAKALRSAIKLYIALNEELDKNPSIKGIGINCLNESRFSDTTPCLAYELLYKNRGVMFACEGDTLSLATQYIINRAMDKHIMMTNIYPFLIGMTALKHEKIDRFPDIENPDDCMLLAHCGYAGFMPSCMSSRWQAVKPVLAIVDKNSVAVDADLPTGNVTLVKLHPGLQKMQTVECKLEQYVQYPGSDCRNGAIIRVKDGHAFIKQLFSHHGCFITGHHKVDIGFVSDILGLEIQK